MLNVAFESRAIQVLLLLSLPSCCTGSAAPFKPPYKSKNPEPGEGEVSAKNLEMLTGEPLLVL